MIIPFYQVDAFTSEVFGGNPAAVCPLDDWLSDDLMLKIAGENNLSETAFFVANSDENAKADFHLRWFTPAKEVELCGHATLATAHVIFAELGFKKNTIKFDSHSGILSVEKTTNGLTMDFPAWAYEEKAVPDLIYEALSPSPKMFFNGIDGMAVFESAEEVRALKPNMYILARYKNARGVLATAPGDGDYDFVSRAFFPNLDIAEDPITGSAHCMLVPYWAEQLGKTRLKAYQASKRGGEILCELLDDRVSLTGQAVLYAKGEIYA